MIATPPAIHAPAEVNLPRLLYVLAIVESGNSWSKIGSMGERSPWQIKKIVWLQHMPRTKYFEDWAGDEVHSYMAMDCATKHIAWISGLLRGRQVAVTPEHIIICWHMGFGAGIKVIRRGETIDEARRAANLYNALR